MNDRFKYNLLLDESLDLRGFHKAQEIDDKVFKTDKLFISTLAMDFEADVTLGYRKKLEKKWIEIFPKLDNVKFLSLRHRVDQDFFNSVCQMKNLEFLQFWTSTVENITAIKSLTNLRKLHIDSFSRLTDLSPIKDLKHLEWLVVQNCFKIINYDIIGDLVNLKALAIHGDKIAPRNLRLKSLKPFEGLTNLQHLDINTTIVQDMSYDSVLRMKNLKRFDISTKIRKDLREKIELHPNLKAGFFLDWDWENNKLFEGKNWDINVHNM